MKLLKIFMPVVLFLLLALIFTSNKLPMDKDYETTWKKVDSLDKLMQPRSALELVEQIYQQAKSENNTPQLIKANLYRIKLMAGFEENALIKAIHQIENEISTAGTPEKQLLHSIEAELYWRYYQTNRYKILNRTTTVNFVQEDIATWDARKLADAAVENYQLSLTDKEELQKINIESFKPILVEEPESGIFRPTLFDFLAYRAFDFYRNDESGLTRAAERFEINDADYFLPAPEFSTLDIDKPEHVSNDYFALKVLQELLAFHLHDETPQAIIDADMTRLEFVYNKTTLPEKDSLYLSALTAIEELYESSPYSAQVIFKLARFYYQQGNQYNPRLSDDHRWEKKTAAEYCKKAIKSFPGSMGAENCKTLLNTIQKPDIGITAENRILPGKPSLILLKWQNVKRAYFRVLRMDYRPFKTMIRRQDSKQIVEKLLSEKPVLSWDIEIPDEGDFQQHTSEIEIPGLDKGFYVLLAGNNEDFNKLNLAVAWSDFWATNISYISKNDPGKGYELYVLDRTKGSPLKGVAINAYTRDYNYQKRTYEINPWKSFSSDDNGFFEIDSRSEDQRSKSVTLEFVKGDDKLIADQALFIGHHYDNEQKPVIKTFFFTDRSIYRPGQTVYFKAVILEKTGDEYKILPDFTTNIEFRDVNYREVSSVELTTNDYGSVSGSFVIPTGALNGMMTLKNRTGNVNFSVEEYKRPTFEVLFDPIKGSYKLNETISVTGQAMAYAGNTLDGANVTYRVVRKTFFPYRYIFGYSPYFFPPSTETEITNGETVTDNDGRFTIAFKAIPDKEINQRFKPVFHYTVSATVTDINGETHSAEETVSVGAEALFLDVDIPKLVNRSDKNEFELKTANLNGEKQAVQVEIIINKLKDTEQLLLDRPWQKPDEQVIDRPDFESAFPNRVYNDENNPANWERKEVVFNGQLDTGQDSVLVIKNLSGWDKGEYALVMTATDVYGQEVKTEKYFTLFDPEGKQPPLKTYDWFVPLKEQGEPGEEAVFLVGTSARKVNMLYEIQHQGNVVSSRWIHLDREQQKITIPIKEEYRGNFSVQLTFVKDNRVFKNEQVVKVPYTNKKLDLTFESLRSDLLPGGKEKWTITIRDKKGDKVAAEMLASMYDASLDAFTAHRWNFNLLTYYNAIISWSATGNFGVSPGRTVLLSSVAGQPYHYPKYDRLNWFGYGDYRSWPMKGGRDAMRYSMNGVPVPGNAQMPLEVVEDDLELFSIAEGVNEPVEGAAVQQPEQKKAEPFAGMQVRRDFRETAFFYPQLHTNENGDVVISFTLPESFTRWNFMGLAYTKDLKTGMLEKTFTASKKLMVMPNAPRFFRQGDTLFFTTKVVNLSGEKLEGSAKLEFFDAVTMQPADAKFQLQEAVKDFTAGKGESTVVSWKIVVPGDFNVITYRVKATAGNYSDGEEKTLPVLSNRKLVTEAMPLPVNGNETKTFEMKKLLESGGSKSIKNYRLTLEFSSNPAWYAVQALPVISEPVFKNTVSVFGSFFANSIAFYLANDNPKIKRVFESWKNQTPESLLSNLEKNQDLKNLLLEQTPWVMQARNESERKQRIALLFDINNMQNRLDASIRLLQKLQAPNGGFMWFEGMRDSRHITQQVVEGFGKLKNLGIIDVIGDNRINKMMTAAVRYLDDRILEDYEKLKKNTDDMEKDHVSATQIQYLYARSFFGNIMINPNCETAFNYYKQQAGKYWQAENIYLQGMIALALNRYGEPETPALIVKSLKERSLENEEMGMYWKQQNGYFWYQAPVETQALMIEVFDEVANDLEAVEKMKIWLLKQKQTNDWKTDRATVEAVYALLGRGTDLLQGNELATIKVGDKNISRKRMGMVEAGTGYFRTSWPGSEITPEMGKVVVEKSDYGVAWGALYWQYFEDLDKITAHETPLSLKKRLFVKHNTPEGPVIEPVEDGDVLSPGDEITVRIELRVDRDMEYVHMQDMRASAFEPVNVLSGYRYNGGLGYYESTRDASVDFFFDYLRKGTYVFEYPLMVSQKGDFSNGITTIQCMYAPEFGAHSEGVRVKVK